MTIYIQHFRPEDKKIWDEKYENIFMINAEQDLSRRKKYYWLEVIFKENDPVYKEPIWLEMTTDDTWFLVK